MSGGRVALGRMSKKLLPLTFALWTGLTILCCMGLDAQNVAFVQQNQIGTGANPAALALASLGAGGRPELIVANEGSGSVDVLRNLGNGFFGTLTTQSTGSAPRAVTVADFNRDGNPDVAIANFASNNVTVFLGNSNGTLRLFATLASNGPVALLAADFNGDGKPDLAVVQNSSNSVSIFLGNGTGTFTPFSTAGTGDHPVSIAAADLNGDGNLDLVVANSNSNDVSILLGTGGGTFLSTYTFGAGPAPAYLALGDFNGDGIIDLAVANAAGSSSFVSMLLGAGGGIFAPPRTFPAGNNPTFLVTGDFNLDGKADLAVANTGSSTISIFLGTGDGSFFTPLDFSVGNAPAWITVADLNADGKPDLLVANSASNSVSVLINRTVTPAVPIVSSVLNAAALRTGPVAPGELITVSGSNLGPGTPATPQIDSSGFVTARLAETQALFDGIPSPILYAASGQVSAVVPYEIAGRGSTQLVIRNAGQASAPLRLDVAGSTPALFTLDSTGQGQGAILNQDGSVNSDANPAARGSVVTLYATGAGQTDPPGVDGLISESILPAPLLAVSVSIGGQTAQVLYAGAAPGLVSGVLQINVQLPAGLSSGAVPVILQVGNTFSQPGVTLSVL